MNLLHIYAQYAHHGEAIIAGSPQALIELSTAIDRAIENGTGAVEPGFITNDGEGFEVVVITMPADHWGNAAQMLPVPYTADYARNRSNAKEQYLNQLSVGVQDKVEEEMKQE